MNLLRVLVAHVPAVTPGLLLHAPLDVILADTTIVQPDIVYVALDRLERVSGRGIEGAPTLAVEILSPSTRTLDRVTKRQLHARYRVPVDLPPFGALGLVPETLGPEAGGRLRPGAARGGAPPATSSTCRASRRPR